MEVEAGVELRSVAARLAGGVGVAAAAGRLRSDVSGGGEGGMIDRVCVECIYVWMYVCIRVVFCV